MNNNLTPRISSNDAKGEWPSLLVDKTIYKWQEQLWTGRWANGRVELTPLTQDERDYLDKRGALNGLVNY